MTTVKEGKGENVEPLYKILVGGKSAHGGNLTWSLPTSTDNNDWQPGNWHGVEGKLVPCENGIHLCTWEQIWGKWMKADADVYLAEPDAELIQHEDKVITRAARLLQPVELPDWWIKTQVEIGALQNVKWLEPDGNPLPEWKLFTGKTWDSATDAARGAAWYSARGAATDAALYIGTEFIAADLPIDAKHREYVRRRWQAWQKGWAVLCDVDGTLYVYGVI